MASKYSEKDVEFIIKVLNGDVLNKFIIPFIINPKLSERFANYISSPNLYSEKEISNLFELIYDEFASKLKKEQFDMLKDIKPEAAEKFIPHIINNPEFYDGGLTQNEITELVLNSNSSALIQRTIEDEEIGLNGEQIIVLMTRLNELEENAQDETKYSLDSDDEELDAAEMDYDRSDTYDLYEDVSDKKKAESLKFTKAELFAIKVYEGIAPGTGVLSADHDAYRMINAMLFPGIDNEIIRVCDDDQFLDHRVAENPEELLKISVDLYTAMYKYGKKMEAPAYTRRIDREASFPEMEKRGEIVSNFSTTTAAYNPLFTKENMVLVEVIVEQGVVCADFAEIFREAGEGYRLSNEAEILIAPFTPATFEDAEFTAADRVVKDVKGKMANRKVKMRVMPPEKPKPLTSEEKKEKEEQLEIFSNPEKKANAARVLKKMQKLRSISKREIMRFFSENEIEEYIEWKNAYQTIYRYETRERALEIEKALATELGLEEISDEVVETSPSITDIQREEVVISELVTDNNVEVRDTSSVVVDEPIVVTNAIEESIPGETEIKTKEDSTLVGQLAQVSQKKSLSGINGAIKKIIDIVKGKKTFSKSSVNKNDSKDNENYNENK